MKYLYRNRYLFNLLAMGIATFFYPFFGSKLSYSLDSNWFNSSIKSAYCFNEYGRGRIWQLLPISNSNCVWIVGDNGAVKFDPETRKTINSITKETNKKIPGGQFRSMCEDSQNRIWFCCWDGKDGKGIVVYDYSSNEYLYLSTDSKRLNIPMDDIVYLFYWGTYKKIIAVTLQGQWFEIREDCTSSSTREVSLVNPRMCIDKKGTLWVAHFNGLGYFETNKNRDAFLKKVLNCNDADEQYRTSLHFNDISLYDNNKLLLSTAGGYAIYDINSKRLTNHITNNGSNHVPYAVKQIASTKNYICVAWPLKNDFSKPMSIFNGSEWMNFDALGNEADQVVIDQPIRCIEKNQTKNTYYLGSDKGKLFVFNLDDI